MSKKNLSLLMDGFMGEGQSKQNRCRNSLKEQATEQAEQPTAQTDKQEVRRRYLQRQLLKGR